MSSSRTQLRADIDGTQENTWRLPFMPVLLYFSHIDHYFETVFSAGWKTPYSGRLALA
jgi:hypothetical protein